MQKWLICASVCVSDYIIGIYSIFALTIRLEWQLDFCKRWLCRTTFDRSWIWIWKRDTWNAVETTRQQTTKDKSIKMVGYLHYKHTAKPDRLSKSQQHVQIVQEGRVHGGRREGVGGPKVAPVNGDHLWHFHFHLFPSFLFQFRGH